MNTIAEPRNWFEQLLTGAQPHLSGTQPDWLGQARAHAREAIHELPLPQRKLEDWRYTSIESLLQNHFQTEDEAPTTASPKEVAEWLESAVDAYRLVFVNGRYDVRHSSTDLPEGVTLGSLREALATDPDRLSTWFGQTLQHSEQVFTALNTALMNDGLLLHLDHEVTLERPIEVIYLNLDRDNARLSQPRNLVVLEAGAKATLVERCVGAEQAVYFHNTVTELVLHEQAELRHYRVQDESREAYHLSSLYLSQDRDSRYLGTTLSFGSRWARTEYHSRFRQEGAHCELFGLYTVGDRQLADFHLNVQHSVPGCSSREQFKGILYGKGRAVFDGRILVEKQAQRSDAQLRNDNLMLTRDAEVDTKPQLEIYADDVKCSHGTTVGQIDPQQVFYLRSRGIDEATARRMLCLGYAGEIIDSIGIPALRSSVTERLAATLDATLDG